jgi:hypothetical protein
VAKVLKDEVGCLFGHGAGTLSDRQCPRKNINGTNRSARASN